MPSAPNVTELLFAWQAGDQAALDELLPAIQPKLRRIARRHWAGERRGQVLQPAALAGLPWPPRVDATPLWARTATHE
jgi:hypothetical protein